jgi:L-aminopeptidase/D-esterase-like protein
MTDCPKFAKMHKTFHGKSMTVIEVQPVVETQMVIMDVNVVDVNVTTRSKVTEEHVFKARKLKKTKSVVD